MNEELNIALLKLSEALDKQIESNRELARSLEKLANDTHFRQTVESIRTYGKILEPTYLIKDVKF